MQLNPRLAKRLEQFEPNHLKALLMWFNADATSISTQSQTLKAILDEVESLDMDSCYQLAGQLELDEMVQLSILNEFGPQFEQKTSFPYLSRSVRLRLI